MSGVPSDAHAVVRRAMEERKKVERAVAAIAAIIPDDLEYVQCPDERERRVTEAITRAGVADVLFAHPWDRLLRRAWQVARGQG